METLTMDIKNEIKKLRLLKQSVFEADSNNSDMISSNICLSADVLLIPLYWFLSKSQCKDSLPMEEYMREAVFNFESKASTLVPRLIEKTKDLDKRYSSQPFKSYRTLLRKCYPEFV